MKVDELTIEVKAGISIERKTAETCLKLLELYVNSTGNEIVAHIEGDGTVTFSFVEGAEEPTDRPLCCIEHNVYGATCDTCEFGEVDGEVLQYLRDIGEVEE